MRTALHTITKRKRAQVGEMTTDALRNILGSLSEMEAGEPTPEKPLWGLVHITGIGAVPVGVLREELALREQSDLTPRPGHVVEIPAPGYSCDFCGDPATWDGPTVYGPWANMCDTCEPIRHAHPGQTGVGIGQRLVVVPLVSNDPTEIEHAVPGTVGDLLAFKEREGL